MPASAADVAQVSRPKRRLAGTSVANVGTLQENQGLQQLVTSGGLGASRTGKGRVWRGGCVHSIFDSGQI